MVSAGSHVTARYLHAWKDTNVHYVLLLCSLDNLCEYSGNQYTTYRTFFKRFDWAACLNYNRARLAQNQSADKAKCKEGNADGM